VRPNKTQSSIHETRAWELRSRGLPQHLIAEQIGVSQQAVSKILARIESRELKRLSGNVERLKLEQTCQLDHVITESIEAWHRSKKPKHRAIKRTVSGGRGRGGEDDDQADEDGSGTETTEAIERDGDAAYLYAAMNAMDRKRSLWGLDVAPALQDPASSVAELARDLLKRADAYEQRAQADSAVGARGTDSPDSVGIAEVPGRPGEV
jgi:predicted transcriptional regulator